MLEIRYKDDETWKMELTTKSDGVNIENTIDNFILVMENDNFLKNIYLYNEFSNQYEYHEEGKSPRPWTDTDDANVMRYLEKNYGLYNDKKYEKSLKIVMQEHKYHPLKELLENKEWDGVKRIDNFLKDILKCDISEPGYEEYYREVSRMIFYGGIARLYTPGVKFDYMPILIGKQGTGKSTIVMWLALNANYYREVTTVDGNDGIECLESGWICEFSELLAMVRQKDVQALKAFITRQVDKYRVPYDKHVSNAPRQCIFIGTTNDYEFLTDDTGNRRYLPVEVGLERGELYDEEEYVKNYILECWREALCIMKNDKDNFYLTIPKKYNDIVDEMQNKRMVEDPRLSELQGFLEEKAVGDKVCSRMIWKEAFRGIERNANKSDFKMISRYMNKFDDWIRVDSTITFDEYGKQKYWMKRR